MEIEDQPTIMDKSPWDSNAIFIFFCHFLVPSENSASFSKLFFLHFSLPPPPHPTLYKVETRKNSGYTLPKLFVELWEGLDLCELEMPQKCKSVQRLLSMIVD